MNQPLAEAIFWIGALACVIAEVMILKSSFAATRENKSALVPTASRRSELAWAILPAVLLGIVLFATWRNLEARAAHMRMNHPGMDPAMHMSAEAR